MKTKQPKPSAVRRADDATPQEHSADLKAVTNVLSTPRDPNSTSVKAQAEIGNALSVESQKTVIPQQ
jgi:hypothetical protein